MIIFSTAKEKAFLDQYLKDDIHLEKLGLELENLKSFSLFTANLSKVEPSYQEPRLVQISSKYSIYQPIMQILVDKLADFSAGYGDVSLTALQNSFDQLMVEAVRSMLGAWWDSNEKIRFNHRQFADFILAITNIAIEYRNGDELLIYNKVIGYWETVTSQVRRLIIQVSHFAGGDTTDSWNSILEKNVTDIILRKAKIVEIEKFNKGYFPLMNYTIESSSGEIINHCPSQLASFGSPVEYVPEAKCPVFRNFVAELFQDGETADFIQEWFGYILSTSHKANSLLIGVGSGSNGKSTLFKVLEDLVGPLNTSSAPLSNFNAAFGLEPMVGKKLNLASESDPNGFQTGKLKAITAGEAISINRKNKPEVSLILPTKLVFLVNELPLITDSSYGYSRRLIILPFNLTIGPDKQDKNLPVKLNQELSGILNWSLEGLKRLIQNNYKFTISTEMREAKVRYLGVGNPVHHFVKEFIINKPNHRELANDIFQSYNTWMMIKGWPYKGTDANTTFWREFKSALALEGIEFVRRKSSGDTYIHDVKLNH